MATRRGRGQEARGAEHRERVFELRLAGATFRQIAKEVGLSHQRCFQLYRDELRERAERTAELADQYVQQQLERYEKIILAHWAQRGDTQHAMAIMRAMDAQAKLCGLHVIRHHHEGTVDVVHEAAAERRRRIMEETADAIAAMTPEELAAEAAGL